MPSLLSITNHELPIANPPPISLPLDSLLDLLERDFELSPDLRLRAQQALHVWGKDYVDQPERLKYLLAPLFAQNETQQAQFYQTFDQWLRPYLPQDEPEPTPDEPEILVEARRRWQRPLIATALLLLTATLTWILWPRAAEDLPPPGPHFSVSSQCARVGQPIAFTDQTPERQVDSTLRLLWDFGDGAMDTTSSAPQHTYQQVGTYSVTLTVWRQGKDSSLTKFLYVHDTDRPIATFSYDTLDTGEIRFTPDSIRTEWRYRWELGDGTQRASREITIAIPPDTEFEATLVVSLPNDSLGLCSARHTELIDTRQTLVKLPELEPLRLPTDYGNLQWTDLTWILLALMCLLIWLIPFAWERYRKRLQPSADLSAALQEADAPPIDLPFPNQESLIEESPDLMALAETLRQRQEGERERLDLRATLKATVQDGGFPSLRFQRPSRPSEYLALVEMSTPRDQQARLFARLLHLLQREQVKLEVWFYQKDPSWCFRHPEAEPLSLDRLYQLFPRHRLLIFGTGENLLDLEGEALAPHLRRSLTSWNPRALFTPLPVADWANRERSLHDHFVLLPADLPGQLSLTETWAEAEETENFKALKRRLLRQRPDQPAEQDYDFKEIDDLREYLGETRFQWLAAAALYPKPAWAITLALAARLGPAPILEDLLRLTRIPWLRDGQLSESLRAQLAASLDEAGEQKARAALRDLLDTTPVTPGSFAAREKHIQLTVQRAFLNPDDVAAQQELRLLWEQGLLDTLARGQWKMRHPAPEEEAEPINFPLLWKRFRWVAAGILLFVIGSLGLASFTPSAPVWQSIGLAESQLDSLAWYIDTAGASIDLHKFDLAEHYLDAVTVPDAPSWVDSSSNLPLSYQRGYRFYRMGLVAYNQRDWQTAVRNFDLTETQLNWIYSIDQDTLFLSFRNNLLQHAHHAAGLVAYYQNRRDSARAFLDSLSNSFLRNFGEPNLATLLGETAPADTSFQYLLRVTTGEFPAGNSDPDPSNGDSLYITLIGSQDSLVVRLDSIPQRGRAQFEWGRGGDTWRFDSDIELGNLEAIRFWFTPDADGYDDWFIETVQLTDQKTGQTYRLSPQGWLGNMGEQKGSMRLSLDGSSQTQLSLAGVFYLREGQNLEPRSFQPRWRLLAFGQDRSQAREILNRRTEERGIFGYSIPRETIQPGEDSLLVTINFQVPSESTRREATKALGIDQLPKLDLKVILRQPGQEAPDTSGDQTITLSGTVVPANRTTPFSGTTITINGIDSTQAEPDGTFSLSIDRRLLTNPRVILNVGQSVNHESKTLSLSLYRDTTITIQLTPSPRGAEVSPPTMIRIPGGSFRMGSKDGESNEEPVHRVQVSTFFLSETEVTNAQYAEFLNAKGNQEEGGVSWYDEEGPGYNGYAEAAIQVDSDGQWQVKEGRENHPVNYVSWYGARAYAQWLSEQTGQGYRLPTEAEWEYAAGGGDTLRTRYAGTDSESELGQYAWYYVNSNSQPQPVRQKRPNRLGLYDMSGNVWEWCVDWYGDYPSEPQVNPTGPAGGSYRVIRGGSWFNFAGPCRVAVRGNDYPEFRNYYLGFRVARQF